MSSGKSQSAITQNAPAAKTEPASKKEQEELLALQKSQENLENANIEKLFSPMPTPDSVQYEVQKGDTLSKIARKFSTTQVMILRANNLKDSGIVPLGRKLKVHNEKISIVVDRAQNILTLKSADKIIKTYRVSTGVNNSTPVGTFKIVNKIVNPPWYTAGGVIPPDSPKNILGSRWLGLSAQGYGIHGTTEPQSIGKQVTSGCVRMKNAEVEELYDIVPEGTEVVIVD
jgi:lipoprotein-anchoring transpeptidase ErfK/SrfK